MAAVAPDVIASPVSSTCEGSSSDGHGQSTESSMALDSASTPFPVLPAVQEELDRASTLDRRPARSASSGARLRVISSSSSGSCPRSILVSTDPVIHITPAAEAKSRESSPESYPSPSTSSSESESPRPSTNDSSRTTLSSGFGSDSAASSTCTRATTLCSTSITFAPLPEIGPRKRRSSRPLGIAARGQILRQRRMMMAQDKLSYYDDSVDTSIPFNRPPGGKSKEINEKARRDDLEDTEIALAALGKMLGEATKNLWQRVAHSKAKDSSGAGVKTSPKRPKPSRGLTWPGRKRSKSSPGGPGLDSDDSDDEIDGPWSRRRNEDPMTKTIMEGSDDGLEQFVLQYDTLPSCEEEEEEFANARADEEMRTTVEVHLVKTSDGESED